MKKQVKEFTRRRISFGKVHYIGTGRRNEVTLEVCLEKRDGKWSFSACGELWNQSKTDILMGGQCIDTLAKNFPHLLTNRLFRDIFETWKAWHLNTLEAGSPKQREFRDKNFKVDRTKATWHWYDKKDVNDDTDSFGRHVTDSEKVAKEAERRGFYVRKDIGDYNDQLHVALVKAGLYADKSFKYKGKPYKYGSAWLCREIPQDVLEKIATFETRDPSNEWEGAEEAAA